MKRRHHQAKPAKLPSGQWGAAVLSDDVNTGDQVTITTRAGESWEAIVSQIISARADSALVSTRRDDGPEARRLGRTTSGYCGLRCAVTDLVCCPANGQCHDCI